MSETMTLSAPRASAHRVLEDLVGEVGVDAADDDQVVRLTRVGEEAGVVAVTQIQVHPVQQLVVRQDFGAVVELALADVDGIDPRALGERRARTPRPGVAAHRHEEST
ncbi:hypothetical protein P3T27_005012 [Kitasatospora sp. MAA19]|uniref:hypothetical protein n=1 Tax=unclassified Kitasatospora TaxID=2633591 RepID=UPI002475463B|nr:hypothetical protein [Kitasatospora sp. MAA19]MDH6708273.1 hypothetical protein [Kitasatospora sp. MAA19]